MDVVVGDDSCFWWSDTANACQRLARPLRLVPYDPLLPLGGVQQRADAGVSPTWYVRSLQGRINMQRWLLISLLLAGALTYPSEGRVQDVAGCGSLQNAFGPFDYRDPAARAESLQVVERYHFTADVEMLRRGKASANVLDDLNYTLRAFPNHHRALTEPADK